MLSDFPRGGGAWPHAPPPKYATEALVQRLCTDTSLEFIISIVFEGFMGDTSRKKEQKKPTQLLNKNDLLRLHKT